MANYINYRMRITTNEGRVIIGTFLAYDKYMNIILADSEEFRKVNLVSHQCVAASFTRTDQVKESRIGNTRGEACTRLHLAARRECCRSHRRRSPAVRCKPSSRHRHP